MEKHKHRKKDFMVNLNITLIVAVAVLFLFNQLQIYALTNNAKSNGITSSISSTTGKDVSNIDLSGIKSTGHSVAALFPVENIKSSQDAINVMIPTGTPDYGAELGVSYDDPVNSLSILANKVYPSMLEEIKKDNEVYQRYLNIVLKPVGISCEFCCGVGAVGARKDGSSICGCQHNPALLGLTMWLVKNTDYSDTQIVKEALKWKSLFFPKNMVELALTVAGGDTSKLNNLPGMVGGC